MDVMQFPSKKDDEFKTREAKVENKSVLQQSKQENRLKYLPTHAYNG